MNEKTLKALKESIAHWERLSTGTYGPDEGLGPRDCALCSLFFDRGCNGCPVMRKTGLDLCRGTPYPRADKAHCNWGLESWRFKTAARKELAFLKSLLPKKGKKK